MKVKLKYLTWLNRINNKQIIPDPSGHLYIWYDDVSSSMAHGSAGMLVGDFVCCFSFTVAGRKWTDQFGRSVDKKWLRTCNINGIHQLVSIRGDWSGVNKKLPDKAGKRSWLHTGQGAHYIIAGQGWVWATRLDRLFNLNWLFIINHHINQ